MGCPEQALSAGSEDLNLAMAKVRSFFHEPQPPWTLEELLERLDGAVCKGEVGGVAVIEPASGGAVWTPQRDVDLMLSEGLLVEVTEGAVTRLFRP